MSSENSDAEQRRRPPVRSAAGKYSLLDLSSTKKSSVPATRSAGGHSATAAFAAPDASLSSVAEGAPMSSPRRSRSTPPSSKDANSSSPPSQSAKNAADLANALEFSPKVIALTAIVNQNRQTIDNFQNSALSLAFEDPQAPQVTDEGRRLVQVLQEQLADSERALTAAKAEVAFAHQPSIRKNPLRLARPKGSLKFPSSAVDNEKYSTMERRRLARGFYSSSEANLLRNADDILAEDRSQDSADLPLLGNGYRDDGSKFINDGDSDLPSELRSSTDNESSDPDSAHSGIDDLNSDDEEGNNASLRLSVVCDALAHRNCFDVILADAALIAHRAQDIVIKHRTSRSAQVELILNHWLQRQQVKPKPDLFVNFLKLLGLHPPEYQFDICEIIIKIFKPLSPQFFRFLYSIIVEYKPTIGRIFVDAIKAQDKKHTRRSESSSSSVSTSVSAPTAITATFMPAKPKPTVHAPHLRDIADIADVVGRFHTQYRAYERDQGYCERKPKSVFSCLDPVQQENFASMSLHTEAYCQALSNDEIMDLFRVTFGFKCSASALVALNDVAFTGHALQTHSWSDYNAKFLRTFNQIPISLRPPSKEVAKRYMNACPSSFLRNDVLAMEPIDHAEALKMVMLRLNDAGFVRSASRPSAFFAPLRPSFTSDRPKESFGPAERERHRDRDSSNFNRDRSPHNDRFRSGNDRPRESRDTNDRTRENRDSTDRPRERRDSAAQAPRAPTPPAPKADGPICRRCRKVGHLESMCVSKHDDKGERLPRQDDEVYAQRRKAYQALLEKKGTAAVNAVQESSSETSECDHSQHEVWSSDDSDHCHAIMSDISDDDSDTSVLSTHSLEADLEFPALSSMVYSLEFPTIPTMVYSPAGWVPAPPLVGIEPNPGPKVIRKRPFHREPRVNRPWELLAFILLSQHISTTSASFVQTQPSASAWIHSSVIFVTVAVAVCCIFVSSRPRSAQQAQHTTRPSLPTESFPMDEHYTNDTEAKVFRSTAFPKVFEPHAEGEPIYSPFVPTAAHLRAEAILEMLSTSGEIDRTRLAELSFEFGSFKDNGPITIKDPPPGTQLETPYGITYIRPVPKRPALSEAHLRAEAVLNCLSFNRSPDPDFSLLPEFGFPPFTSFVDDAIPASMGNDFELPPQDFPDSTSALDLLPSEESDSGPYTPATVNYESDTSNETHLRSMFQDPADTSRWFQRRRAPTATRPLQDPVVSNHRITDYYRPVPLRTEMPPIADDSVSNLNTHVPIYADMPPLLDDSDSSDSGNEMLPNASHRNYPAFRPRSINFNTFNRISEPEPIAGVFQIRAISHNNAQYAPLIVYEHATAFHLSLRTTVNGYSMRIRRHPDMAGVAWLLTIINDDTNVPAARLVCVEINPGPPPYQDHMDSDSDDAYAVDLLAHPSPKPRTDTFKHRPLATLTQSISRSAASHFLNHALVLDPYPTARDSSSSSDSESDVNNLREFKQARSFVQALRDCSSSDTSDCDDSEVPVVAAVSASPPPSD